MKEKKGKKEKGKKRLAAASTDRREGAARQLHGGTRRAYCLHEKIKSSMVSNFSHAVVLSPPFGPPPLATWPSPIWPVSYAPSLFRTAIALTFPLCLVPAFFFFRPSSRTSAGQCQLRYHRRRHLPSRTHWPYPLVAATNPVTATSTLPLPHQSCSHLQLPPRHPLHRPSHASCGTKATPPPSLSLCLVPPKYLFYFILF